MNCYMVNRPDAAVVNEYHNHIFCEVLKIIEDITGIQVAYADPFLADVSLYIDYESEPEFSKQYEERFKELCKAHNVPEEHAEYLKGMNFSVIALAFMMYNQQ